MADSRFLAHAILIALEPRISSVISKRNLRTGRCGGATGSRKHLDSQFYDRLDLSSGGRLLIRHPCH